MNRLANRTTIALFLILVLLCGLVFFFVEFMIQAENWVAFEGSPHIYIGGNMRCGVVTDRAGEILLSDLDERSYSNDLQIRQSTIHWVGDRVGYISAPAASYYAEKIIGYNRISGLYSYAGTGGKAEMTLSADLQKIALEAMGNLKGTVAVYNYVTGEILCAVTTPNYDPDNVPDIAGNEEGIYEGIYLNRFTQVSYVPGSIFKLVTTAAALEKLGPDAAELNFNCNGTYQLGVDQVTCAKSHGNITMKTALAKSCNCYYAQLITLMGGDALEAYVEQFQITEPLFFDGITTRAGNFDVEDAAKVEIAWSGIGQHLDLVNPARFMTFMGAIAAGGEAAQPYVISGVSNNGKITYAAETETTGQIMSSRTAELLTELMRNNVTQIYGDGYFPGLSVCAKSGTAEVGGGELPNATFAGFVADEAYPLAFVCMVENAGAGSEVCVPIVSKVLAGCKNLLDAE